MSGYQRFVSYIYEYNRGRKFRNTGFAKIESRGGICKLQIHLQGVPEEEGMMEVRAFVREGGWLKGIFLGRVKTREPLTEARIITPSEHVGNVDYSLENLSGLWISSERGGTYLSIWDDEPVELDKLVMQIPGEKTEETDSTEYGRENTQTTESEGEVPPVGQIPVSEEAPNREPENSAIREIMEEGQPETREIMEEGQPETGEIMEEGQPETGEMKEETALPQAAEEETDLPERKPIPPDVEKAEAALDADTDRTAGKEQAAPEAEVQEKEEVPDTESEAVAAACPANPGVCPKCRRPIASMEQRWQCLSRRYSHIQPFGGEEVIDCVQVSPRDLGMLYQNQWPVGRNSFLMHGYYSYRHLLFGKCRDGSYFLGIPGIYENQERMMADMFGFPMFRETKEQKQLRGRFGYWCRKLEA